MLKKFLKWLDNDLEETILMILLVIMACVMMLQVIMRYVFTNSLSWPEEFCRYTFVVSGFLSIGYCIRKDKMLKVDILLGFFPDWLKKAVDLIGRVITLVFFAYLTYYSYFYVLNAKSTGVKSSALKLPMWMLYSSVFIGCALGVIREIQDLYRWFKKNGKKSEENKIEEKEGN